MPKAYVAVRWLAASFPREAAEALVEAFGTKVRDYAVEGAPEREGTYKRSIVLDGHRVIARAAHALFVEEDTRAHTILPRRKPFLAWEDPPGTWHYAREVHHPGTKGQHVLGRAVRRALDEKDEIAKPALERVLRRHAI